MNLAPASTNTEIGNNSATSPIGRLVAPKSATVLNVTVAEAPLLLTVIGLLPLKTQIACDGMKDTFEVTLHERVTLPAYPLMEVMATIARDVLPGLIDAGLATPAERE